MSYSQMIELLKLKHKGKILLVKTGAFYVATAEDAIFLHDTIGLKYTCFKNYVCKVGVPEKSLNKYIEEIDKLKVGYVVYDFIKEKSELQLKIQKEGKEHKEKRVKLNCLECKGIKKYLKKINLCFIKGKIIEEINFSFLYNMNKISVAKTKLKLENESVIVIKGYDEMADWMVQNIKKEDEVILQGKINTKMEVEVKWMKR